jgi:hypothetical protein
MLCPDEVNAYSLPASMNVSNNHIFAVLEFFTDVLSLEGDSTMLFKMSGTNHQVMWHYITEDRDIHYTDVKA